MDADALLMQKVKDGDDRAFDLLINRYKKPLINFVYRMVHDPALAEELAQEVFFRVYLARHRYTPSARFSTWLFTVATNTTLKHLRKSKRWVREAELSGDSGDGGGALDRLGAVSGEGAFEAVEREELGILVRQALGQLPEKEKVALTLRKYEDCSYQEIAEIMRCSVAAIKTHIHRGKLRLREILLRMERRLDPAASQRQV